MKPRLLDLFCGAGGATKGYQLAGFEVVGVDIEPQPNYCGDKFIRADALETLHGGWDWMADTRLDAIHASPPCQAYSSVTPEKSKHPDLVAQVRSQLKRWNFPYVIENVPGAPLEDPVTLCGSSFGLPLRRHRLFETNFSLMAPPCAHGQQEKRFDIYEHGKWRMSAAPAIYGSGGGKAKEHWAEALGIDWMTHDEMALAIPPAYTEWIGHYLLTAVARSRVA